MCHVLPPPHTADALLDSVLEGAVRGPPGVGSGGGTLRLRGAVFPVGFIVTVWPVLLDHLQKSCDSMLSVYGGITVLKFLL